MIIKVIKTIVSRNLPAWVKVSQILGVLPSWNAAPSTFYVMIQNSFTIITPLFKRWFQRQNEKSKQTWYAEVPDPKMKSSGKSSLLNLRELKAVTAKFSTRNRGKKQSLFFAMLTHSKYSSPYPHSNKLLLLPIHYYSYTPYIGQENMQSLSNGLSIFHT